MEHTITIKDNIFEMKGTESANAKGFIAIFDELAKNESWTSGSKLLGDLRLLEDFNTTQIDFSDISSVTSFIKKRNDRFMNMKVATLINDEMEPQVIIGLWESLMGYCGSGFEHRIFTNYEQAFNWLKSH